MGTRTYSAGELERRRELIRNDAETRHGIIVVAEEFQIDHEDGDVKAVLRGRWVTVNDDEDRGLYEGDEGELHVGVVGAPEHNNERVAYLFKREDEDEATTEVDPSFDVEAL